MSRIRPPKDARISIRTTEELKRKAAVVKEGSHYTDEDFWRIGMEKLASRLDLLEYEKGERELRIADLKSQLYKEEAELCNVNNEIRIIEPRKLNDVELASLMGEVSHEYAKRIFKGFGERSLDTVNTTGKSAVLSYGRKNGFDPNQFFDLVMDHLDILVNSDECMTSLSYSSK